MNCLIETKISQSFRQLSEAQEAIVIIKFPKNIFGKNKRSIVSLTNFLSVKLCSCYFKVSMGPI